MRVLDPVILPYSPLCCTATSPWSQGQGAARLERAREHQEAGKRVKSNKGSAAAAAWEQTTSGDRGALATAPCSPGQRARLPPGACVLIWSNDSAGVLGGGGSRLHSARTAAAASAPQSAGSPRPRPHLE